MKRIPRCVVLSGGGTRCISFVGGLLYLQKIGALEAVRRWYCCSAGAFIAVLFSLGMPKADILKFVHEFDFSVSRNFTADDILSVGETFGFDKGFALRKMIAGLLESIRKGSSRWTLREFKEATGNDIYFFISNITLSVPFYASAASHPDLFLLDATFATMAIPLYFCPYKDLVTGHLWCDGMLGGNFPWQHVPDVDKRDAIGFYFPQRTLGQKVDFFDFLNLIISFRNNYEQRKLTDAWSDHIISVPTSDYPSIALDLSKEDRETLYSIGLREVKTWWLTTGCNKFTAFAGSRNSGSPPYSEHPRTRSPSLPHLEEPESDSLTPSRSPCKDSHPSRDLLPASPRSSRRWSV
jgi:hypothetical protein